MADDIFAPPLCSARNGEKPSRWLRAKRGGVWRCPRIARGRPKRKAPYASQTCLHRNVHVNGAASLTKIKVSWRGSGADCARNSTANENSLVACRRLAHVGEYVGAVAAGRRETKLEARRNARPSGGDRKAWRAWHRRVSAMSRR